METAKKKVKLTEARASLLREIAEGRSAYKEMYGKRSYAKPNGSTRDVTLVVAWLYAADLVKLIPDHNGWRLGWAPTPEGLQALADHG